MAKSKTNQKTVKELTYEEAVAELDGIVERLENASSDTSLEESMKLFERGQALAAYCGILLENARLKVQKITGESLVALEDEAE